MGNPNIMSSRSELWGQKAFAQQYHFHAFSHVDGCGFAKTFPMIYVRWKGSSSTKYETIESPSIDSATVQNGAPRQALLVQRRSDLGPYVPHNAQVVGRGMSKV